MWFRGFLLLSVAAVSPAMAQSAGGAARAPTVEQYLCTFAKKCSGSDAPVETRQAPPTKGFRLARPTSSSGQVEPVSGSAPVRHSASRGARVVTGRSRAPVSYPAAAIMPASRPAYVAGAAPRADLMVGFELNSARLTAEGARAANVFGQSLLRPELMGKRFRIEGHTDSSGGSRINAPLSARRAQAVSDYLVSMGIDRSRIQAQGFGASRPLDGHRASDPANRRVEAELIS